MPYSPPAGDAVLIAFSSSPYTPPAGDGITITFAGEAGQLFVTGWDSAAFGGPTVYNLIQTVSPSGFDNSLFGTPTVFNWNTHVGPSGFTSYGVGTPRLNVLQPEGIAPGRFGVPYIIGPRFLRPGGIAAPGFGTPMVSFLNRTLTLTGWDSLAVGVADPQLFNRNLYPAGWDSFTMSAPVPYDDAVFGPLSNHIGFPRPRFPAGWDSQAFGNAMVDFRIRYLHPEGFDTFSEGYTVGEFDLRMRVSRVDPAAIINSIGDTLQMGAPVVSHAIRTILDAGQIRAGGMGTPDVRFQSNIVLAGYGWDSMVFGDVQRWEAGKIKMQGDDHAVFGNHGKVSVRLYAAGFDSAAFGSPRFADALDPSGFDSLGLGIGTVTHGDAQEFTCGSLPRAIPPQGWEESSFGAPSVA